jgi:hypothetical protein
VRTLSELLDDLGAKRWEIVRVPAGDQPLIGHDLLIDPLTASIGDIGLQARERCQLAPAQDVRLDQCPRAVADRADRLLLLEE